MKIFEKIPASGEKCLILEPREALIYPFSAPDWKDLRVSVALSFTNISSDNGIMPTGEQVGFSTNVRNSFLFGLFSGDNGSLPFQNDTSFVGFGNRTGKYVMVTQNCDNIIPVYSSITVNFNQSVSSSTRASKLIDGFSSLGERYVDAITGGPDFGYTNTDIRYLSIGTGTSTANAPIMEFTGNSNYCKIISTRFVRVNPNLPGQNISMGFSNNQPQSSFSNVSLAKLKECNQSVNFADYTGFYFNSNLSPTGSPFAAPEKLLIQFPFLTSRARIHSILVEKYQ